MKNKGIGIFTFFPISFPSLNCVNSIIKLSMIMTFRFCPVTVIPVVFDSYLKDFKAYLWFCTPGALHFCFSNEIFLFVFV